MIISERVSSENQENSYSSIGHEHGISEGPGELWDTVFGKGLFVEDTPLKHLGRGILAASSGSKLSRHEGLAFGVPSVTIINAHHRNETREESDSLVVLELQGKRSLERCDLEELVNAYAV